MGWRLWGDFLGNQRAWRLMTVWRTLAYCLVSPVALVLGCLISSELLISTWKSSMFIYWKFQYLIVLWDGLTMAGWNLHQRIHQRDRWNSGDIFMMMITIDWWRYSQPNHNHNVKQRAVLCILYLFCRICWGKKYQDVGRSLDFSVTFAMFIQILLQSRVHTKRQYLHHIIAFTHW